MGHERVLAYLRDVTRTGALLRIEDARGHEVPVALDFISEQRVLLALDGPLDLSQGSETHLVFILDGLRFKASTRVLEIGIEVASVELPSAVELAERRKASRACMSAREGAAAIAMAGLFNPLAASSPATREPSTFQVGQTEDHAIFLDESNSAQPHQAGLAEAMESAQALAHRARMPLTSKDVASDATFWTTQVVGWLKARHITLSGHRAELLLETPVQTSGGAPLVYANSEALLHFSAKNPFLGQSAASRRLRGGTLSHGITYTFLSRSLPQSWRHATKLSSVRVEAFCCGNSFQLGFRVK